MKIVSILNHKGGVGKSTIATNIAGYFANQNQKVVMGDFDVQQSSHNWITMRPDNLPAIEHWEMKEGRMTVPPEGTDYIVIDSPAGIRGNSLGRLVTISDKIIVPLKPGIFDMLSTQTFLEEIIELINEQEKEIELCVIGSMVDVRSKASKQLTKYLEGLGLDSPVSIQQAQIYVHLAAHGLTLFDTQNVAFEKEKEKWQPLIDWINA